MLIKGRTVRSGAGETHRGAAIKSPSWHAADAKSRTSASYDGVLAAAAVQRSGPSTGPSVPPLLARVCAPHDTSTPLGFHSSGRRRVCAALAGVFLMAYLCVYCLTCSGAVRCGREQVLRATLHGHSRRSAVFDLLAQPARFPVCFCLSCVVSRILS